MTSSDEIDAAVQVFELTQLLKAAYFFDWCEKLLTLPREHYCSFPAVSGDGTDWMDTSLTTE